MGFLGISGKRWKQIGKIALKAAPIVAAPFTGGASLLALGAGTGALSGALGGGGWKGALMGGALGAIPGGAGGAAASGAAKVGIKELAKGVAKGAATNFATGTATGLATGQGVKQSLAGGGNAALSGIGTTGPAGGFKQAAKTVGKNVALNVGGQAASQGLQKAGVPGGLAAQGGNVFSNYLGNQFKPATPGSPDYVQSPQSPQGQSSGGLKNYLPQAGTNWKDTALRAGVGALTGAQGGGGVRGAVTGAATGATGLQLGGGGAQQQPGQPMYANAATGGGGQPRYANAATGGGGVPAGEGPGTAPQTGGGGQADRPATWAERYGPILAQAGGVALGGYVGKKAQESAMKRSPEELAALGGAQQSAGQLGRAGGSLVQQGQDQTGRSGQYFQTLLGGNRAAMSQAIAGPAAQITGNYRGAERNLNQQGIRGAARDVAAADLNRQRVSQIAGLTTGMQPYAAEQLASMGQNAAATGVGALGNAGNLYQGLLGQGYQNRVYGRLEGGKTAEAIGGLARDAGEVAFKRSPTTGSTTQSKKKKAPPQGGTPTPPPTTSDLPIDPNYAPSGPGVQLGDRSLPVGGPQPNFGPGVPFGNPSLPVGGPLPNFGSGVQLGDYDPYRRQA